MKKLLLVGALLALGATAFAANPDDNYKASANVEVRAELVDDSLVISDIYGKPILLDFGPVQKGTASKGAAEVDYKVTASSAAADKAIGLDIELNGGQENLTLTHVNNPEQTIPVKVNLDKKTGEIEVGDTEYRGKISGSLNTDTSSKELGFYKNFTEITVTVTGQSE